MLVLSREVGQEIILTWGPIQVVLVVLALNPARVRLGFKAPRLVSIFRREVKESIEATTPGRTHVEPGHRVAERVRDAA